MANISVLGAAAGAATGVARGVRRFMPAYQQRKLEERKREEYERLIEEATESIARITGISSERVRDWVVARFSDMPVPFEALEKDPVKREEVAQKVISKIRSDYPDMADVFESRWRFDEDLEPALDFLQQSAEGQIALNRSHQAGLQLYGYAKNGLKDEDYFIPNSKTGMTYFEAVGEAAKPLQAVMPKEEVVAAMQQMGVDFEIDKEARAEAKLRKFFVKPDGSSKKRDEWSQEYISRYRRHLDTSFEKAEDELNRYYKTQSGFGMSAKDLAGVYSTLQADLHSNADYLDWREEKGDDKRLPKYSLQNEAMYDSGALKWTYVRKLLSEAASQIQLNDRERTVLEWLRRNFTGESKEHWRKKLTEIAQPAKAQIGPVLPLPKDEIERILEVFFAQPPD